MDTQKDRNTIESSKKRYRFRTLKERIDATDASVSRRVLADHELSIVKGDDDGFGGFEEDGSMISCFFGQELAQAHDIDRSLTFQAFNRKVELFAQSLPLVVHNLKTIVKVLIEYLNVKDDEFSKVSLLHMTVALAKDVQADLYPFLKPLLDAMFTLINLRDVKLCSEIFKSVGSILVELTKTIVRQDPDLLFFRDHYMHLLSHRRDFIRRFAGEAFAPLFRQMPENLLGKHIKRFLTKMVGGVQCIERNTDEQSEIVDGVSQLIFNLLRNVQNRLHSRTDEILACLFKCLRTKFKLENGLIKERVNCIRRTYELTMGYTTRETSELLWTVLVKETRATKAENSFVFGELCGVIDFCIRFRGGSRMDISVPKLVIDKLVCTKMLEKSVFAALAKSDETIQQNCLKLAINTWRYEHRGRRETKQVIAAINRMVCNKGSDLGLKAIEFFVDDAIESLGVEVVYPASFIKLIKILERTFSDSKKDQLVILRIVMQIADAVETSGLEEIEPLTLKSPIIQFCMSALKNNQDPATSAVALSCLKLCKKGLEKDLAKFIKKNIGTANGNKAISFLGNHGTEKWYGDSSSLDLEITNDVALFLAKNLEKLMGDHKCLQATADLLLVSANSGNTEKLRKILLPSKEQLVRNLRYRSHGIRLASLKILTIVFPKMKLLAKSDDAPDVELPDCKVLDTMIDLESLPVSLGNDRQRETYVNTLEQQIRMGRVPAEFLAVYATFFLGQLCVPYSPLWKVISMAMESFAKQHFDKYLWPPLWEHLQEISQLKCVRKLKDGDNDDEDEDEAETEEKKDDAGDLGEGEGVLNKLDDRERSTDPLELFRQTLLALVPLAKRVESKSKLIVPLFFVFLRDEYYAVRDDLDAPRAGCGEYKYIRESTLQVSRVSSRWVSKRKLISWLELFGGFTKYKDTTIKEYLREINERFLLSSDQVIQRHSLKCLLNMKLPCLLGYGDSLSALVDEEQFRDEMTRFRLDDVPNDQRNGMIRILTRVLYGKLLLRRRKTSKEKFSLTGRRAIVLAFFAGLRQDEAEHFFNLMFRPFPKGIHFDVDPDNLDRTTAELEVNKIDGSRLFGFAQMLEEVIRQLGSLCTPYLDRMLCVVFGIIRDVRERPTSFSSQLRSVLTRRVADISLGFPEYDMTKWTAMFTDLFEPMLETLPASVINVTHAPGLLLVASAFSQSTKHMVWGFGQQAAPSFLQQVIKCLGSGVDTSRGASQSVIGLIYGVLERLLDDQEQGVPIIRPLIPLLLDMLLQRMEGSTSNPSDTTKEGMSLSKRELKMLCAIAPIQQSETGGSDQDETCGKLIDLLVSFLNSSSHGRGQGKLDNARKRESYAEKADPRGDLLLTICGLLERLRSTPTKFYDNFARLLGVSGVEPVYDVVARRNLVDVFRVMYKGTKSPVPQILADLNAWDRRRLGIPDFDKRLGAYEKLGKGAVRTKREMMPVANQALLDMNEEDYPLRSAALQFLNTVVLQPGEMLDVVVWVMMPGIRIGLKSKNALIRKGFMTLLRDTSIFASKLTIEDLPEARQTQNELKKFQAVMFADLAQLANNEDLEEDFFTSVVHIQTYRQSRALASLGDRLRSGELTLESSSLVHVILPMTMHILLECNEEKNAHMKAEGIVMLGEIAKLIPWSHYVALLRNLLERANRKPELHKRLIKAACTVLNSYHFPPASEEPKLAGVLRGQILPLLEGHLKTERRIKGKKGVKLTIRVSVAVAIVKLLKLLPQEEMDASLPRLFNTICAVVRCLDIDGRNEARETLVGVALELGPSHFRLIVQTLREKLKEGYMLHVLGYTVYHLVKGVEPMLVEDIKSRRTEKGQPVPGNEQKNDTKDINEMLQIEVCDGVIDETIPLLMGVIEEELFGDLAKQKLVDSEYHSRVNKLMESRASKAMDLLETLSRVIAFLPSQSIHIMLQPMLQRVYSSTDMKELRVCEEALRRIGLGLASNADVRIPHLLVYIHHLVSSEFGSVQKSKKKRLETNGIEEDTVKRRVNLGTWLVSESETERAKAQERVTRRNAYGDVHIVEAVPQMTGIDRFENKRKRNSQKVIKATKRANRHILVEHALDLLYTALKKKRLTSDVAQQRDMVNPFVDLLAKVCKESYASRTTVLALRVLGSLIPWELPALLENIEVITTGIFGLLRSVGFSTAKGGASASGVGASISSTGADASQECLKTLTVILRDCTFYKIENEQLKMLVLLAQHNMSNIQRQQVTLQMLRVIVERQLVVSEVYDLMGTLTKEVFTGCNTQVRHLCSQVLISFFIHYPLTAKRLRQHLDIIIGNLDFELEDGRLAGLNMLKAIVDKFPVEILDDICEYTFFPLVLRLVNDDSSRCKAAVGVVIKRLFARIGLASVNSLYAIINKWLLTDEDMDKTKVLLQRAAVQVVGLVAEIDKHKPMKLATATSYVEVVGALLESTTLDSENPSEWDEQLIDTEEKLGEGNGWKTTYQALVTLHKLCVHVKSLRGAKRVLLSSDNGKSILQRYVFPYSRFHSHMWIRLAAQRLIGEVLGELDPHAELSNGDEFLSSIDDVFQLAKSQAAVLNFPNINESLADQTVKNIIWTVTCLIKNGCSVAGDEDVERDELENDDLRGISWLIRRLSYTARFKGGKKDDRKIADLRQLSVFKIFAFAATEWKESPNVLCKFLVPMLSSLIRTSTGPQSNIQGTYAAPALAAEVIDLLEQIVGSSQFVRAYSKVQSAIGDARTERKRQRDVEKITDPQAANEKRVHKNQSKRRNKKRKIDNLKKRSGR
uniref:Uncharacterized protein n=1 Tax=Mucochytrium quahogii TaxID=96639 RepID=A0A7S2WQL1_9STRA|mmetsp:Transcript_33783/g.54204  ORF Transcript_33783/g.54204 Transcript_33783/m.54204 type:complete len:2757 (+) Transcript_33783:368-8638(+)